VCGKAKGKTQSERCRGCFNKERWRNPEYRNHMNNANIARWSNTEQKNKHIERNKERWSDPNQRQRQSAFIKSRWSDIEYRQRVSESIKTACADPVIRQKRSIARGGDGDVSRIERAKRGLDEYQASVEACWSRAIKDRDGNRCKHCGTNKLLHAHHIKPRSMFPDLALDLNNGTTLCRDCHIEEHRRMRKETK
jgi:5-methylcytosine-specific restriction endonuclease McrA